MLGLLPLIAEASLWILIGNVSPGIGWRRAFLRSLIVLGGYLVLVTEALSLANGITVPALVAAWTLPTVLLVGLLAARSRYRHQLRLPTLRLPASGFDRLLIGCVVAIVLITCLVAFVAPPTTYDSLNTHMSRVAHWAQEETIAPFASGNELENYYAPQAQMGVLHLYVLAGGDQLVSFVEWLAMIGCVLGASLLAKDLGAGSRGQVLSAVFVASLPMGIAQASSTMTDYVVALWVVCVASECIYLALGGSKAHFYLGTAAALGVLTKPTAFAYLLPFALLASIIIFRRFGPPGLLWRSVSVVLIVLVLNAGYFARNYSLYGTPLGPRTKISIHSNEVHDWRVEVSNLLRNASLHAGTPWEGVNDKLYWLLGAVHVKLGLDLDDPRTSVHEGFQIRSPSTDENRAGNPIQAVLILVAIALLAVWSVKYEKFTLYYALTGILTFAVMSWVFKYTPFGSRYHLAFFVLLAPVVGAVLARVSGGRLAGVVGIVLVVASWPWLVRIESRPLLPEAGGLSAGILGRSRVDSYLPRVRSDEAKEIAGIIDNAGCESVGIMLSGSAAEYPLWVILGAPRSDVQIEWIVAGTPSARYAKPGFEACAVICDMSCQQGMESVRGLPLLYEGTKYLLYIADPGRVVR